MKSHVWDHEFARPLSISLPRRRPRKSVAEILRAAYRKHVRDAHTRRAVRRVLR